MSYEWVESKIIQTTFSEKTEIGKLVRKIVRLKIKKSFRFVPGGKGSFPILKF